MAVRDPEGKRRGKGGKDAGSPKGWEHAGGTVTVVKGRLEVMAACEQEGGEVSIALRGFSSDPLGLSQVRVIYKYCMQLVSMRATLGTRWQGVGDL